MLRSLDYRRLLVKAARLHYEDGLKQSEIGDRLGLSRQKVQRILKEALSRSVVQITVKPIIGIFSDLEQGLEKRFGLAEAVVVETSTGGEFESQMTIAREVGAGAAEYLARVVRPHDRIVTSVGNSLLGMVNALPHSPRLDATDLTVIQGLGGLGDPRHETHATQVVTRLAQALRAEPMLLSAPAAAGTRELRDSFLRDPNVAQTLETARSAEMMFVGIGPTRSDSIVVQDFWKVMQPSAMDDLHTRGAAGSLNLRLFDADGKAFVSEFDERIIGLTLEEIQRIHRVVGVAGGFSKHEAIKAALRGRLINVLVTDHITAQYLLKP
ncbi:MAG: sugar-binding transcriptional regulator [Bryobacteraceae bacterium]|nr:sugar-binding transcriptional regulator [Bryobacteraceae bacterium]